MIEIKTYSETDQAEIIALVLHCQNDGTRPPITINNQPDLLLIKEKYIGSGGNFWVAKENNKVIGCIGLMNYNNGISALKKFFVYESYRGAPHHLGKKLYKSLLQFAINHDIKQLILDTPKNTIRAHKFYQKAGFKQIKKEQLPVIYNPPYEDSDFFCLDLQ